MKGLTSQEVVHLISYVQAHCDEIDELIERRMYKELEDRVRSRKLSLKRAFQDARNFAAIQSIGESRIAGNRVVARLIAEENIKASKSVIGGIQ